MDTHKINLELTLGLLNTSPNKHILNSVRTIMRRVRKEAGAFLGMQLINSKQLPKGLVSRTYQVTYENCIVNLDFAETEGKYFVNSFSVGQPFAQA